MRVSLLLMRLPSSLLPRVSSMATSRSPSTRASLNRRAASRSHRHRLRLPRRGPLLHHRPHHRSHLHRRHPRHHPHHHSHLARPPAIATATAVSVPSRATHPQAAPWAAQLPRTQAARRSASRCAKTTTTLAAGALPASRWTIAATVRPIATRLMASKNASPAAPTHTRRRRHPHLHLRLR